jgi:O-antigen/teichoic acid export membrane protein
MKPTKNLFIFLIPTIVGAIIPIVTLPVFTKILTVNDYGIYGLGLIYGTFVSGLANFGLGIGYERNFFEQKENNEYQGALLFSVLSFVLITFFIFLLITNIFQKRLSYWIIGDAQYESIILYSYCAAGISSFKSYYLTYFKNTNNAKLYSLYSIDEAILNVLFSFILIYYFKTGVVGLLLGQILGSSIIFIFLTIRVKKILKFSINIEILMSCFKISMPLTPRIFYGLLGSQFDKYMIGMLSSIGGVGVYNMGQKFSNFSVTFMTAIQNVFAPQVYKKMFGSNDESNSIGKFLTPFFYLSIGFCLLISFFSEEIITILTPKPFHNAIIVAQILSLHVAIYFFDKQPQLIYAKKTSISSLLSLLSNFVNILINIPFILKWGIVGAAMGALISGFISGFISFNVSQKYYKIQWEYQKLFYIYFSFFIFTLSLIFLREINLDYIYRLLIKMLFLSIFVFIGFKINIIPKISAAHFKKLSL